MPKGGTGEERLGSNARLWEERRLYVKLLYNRVLKGESV